MFCAKCLQGYHLGDCLEGASSSLAEGSCEYTIDPQRLDKARWDEASSVTIKVITKPCPKCRTSTERDGVLLFHFTIFLPQKNLNDFLIFSWQVAACTWFAPDPIVDTIGVGCAKDRGKENVWLTIGLVKKNFFQFSDLNFQ